MPSNSTPLRPRPGHAYPVGSSARSDSHPGGPLRHAATRVQASTWGYNVKALCGTSIRPPEDWVNDRHRGQTFTGTHERDCPRCARIIRHANPDTRSPF